MGHIGCHNRVGWGHMVAFIKICEKYAKMKYKTIKQKSDAASDTIEKLELESASVRSASSSAKERHNKEINEIETEKKAALREAQELIQKSNQEAEHASETGRVLTRIGQEIVIVTVGGPMGMGW